MISTRCLPTSPYAHISLSGNLPEDKAKPSTCSAHEPNFCREKDAPNYGDQSKNFSFTPTHLQLSYSQTLPRDGILATGIMVKTRHTHHSECGGRSKDPQPSCKIKTSSCLYIRLQNELLEAGPCLQPQSCLHLCHQGCTTGRPCRHMRVHSRLYSCSLTILWESTCSVSSNLHNLGTFSLFLKTFLHMHTHCLPFSSHLRLSSCNPS